MNTRIPPLKKKSPHKGILHDPDNTNQVIYFECASCNAGMHNLYNPDIKKEVQKNSFVPKIGDIVPVKVGDWISFKKCPDCAKKTLFRASKPKIKYI